MKSQKFSIRKQIKSIGYAINGFRLMWKDEHNFRIQCIAAIMVCLLGYFLQINSTEWALIMLAIALVMGAEIANTAIENVCNFISPNIDARIKKIKDISAAWVLLMAIIAVVIACFVFIPKILLL